MNYDKYKEYKKITFDNFITVKNVVMKKIKEKNFQILTYKWFFSLTLICFIFLLIPNTSKKLEEINFNNLYSEVSEINVEKPIKGNYNLDDAFMYIQKEYKQIEDSLIFTKKNIQIEILINKKLLENNFDINKNEELIFEKETSNQNSDLIFKMQAWKLNDEMYEILIIDENGNAVVGDIPQNKLEGGILDMAHILNSIKEKEVN